MDCTFAFFQQDSYLKGNKEIQVLTVNILHQPSNFNKTRARREQDIWKKLAFPTKRHFLPCSFKCTWHPKKSPPRPWLSLINITLHLNRNGQEQVFPSRQKISHHNSWQAARPVQGLTSKVRLQLPSPSPQKHTHSSNYWWRKYQKVKSSLRTGSESLK